MTSCKIGLHLWGAKLNRRKQDREAKRYAYDEAVCLAKELKRENDAEIGDWLEDPASVVVHFYRRFGSLWLEAAIPCSANHKIEWNELMVVAAYALRKREVPDALADWLADVLEGKRKRPKGGAKTTSGRDLLLARMVDTLCDNLGIQPTRNKAMKPTCDDDLLKRSACDAVAEVVHLSYETVEKTWYEYGIDHA